MSKAGQKSAVYSFQFINKGFQQKEKAEAQGFFVTFWPPKRYPHVQVHPYLV